MKQEILRVLNNQGISFIYPKPGWSEQNPERLVYCTDDGMKELTKDCDKNQIDGISFSGQMHGMVILDENDKVIRPAILWNDGVRRRNAII